jgi:hypothetical protein
VSFSVLDQGGTHCDHVTAIALGEHLGDDSLREMEETSQVGCGE